MEISSPPVLSVIIPVYNVKNYLEPCLRSILGQSLKSLELLLIDDGSTDGSGLLCDELAAQDSRVKVIHQKNKGLGAARNRGLEIASGKYISFVDSDDSLLNDTYELLINELEMESLDIVIGKAYKCYPNGSREPLLPYSYFPTKILSGEEFLCGRLSENEMSMVVWCYVFKRLLIEYPQINFIEGKYHEDELWTPQVFLKAQRVKGVDCFFYIYNVREGSIIHTNYKKRAKDLTDICYRLQSIYENISNEVSRKILNNNLLSLYLYANYLMNLFSSVPADKKFIKGKAYSLRNWVKVRLLCLNSGLYYSLNRILKRGVK